MHVHIYVQHITITDIKNFMHSYHRFIQVLIFIQVSRRSYRAYSYLEIPVGITNQNDTPLFPLIHYPDYYHITMGIPRPVLIKV